MNKGIPDIRTIQKAHERIGSWIHRTPVLTSTSINKILGTQIFFKCENLQKIGAFKFRGASNVVLSLSEQESKNGVATHSSGNHAQALALAGANRGINAYIVMPKTSTKVKVAAVEGYGGKITFCEPNQQAREQALKKIVSDTGAHFVHPYNDYRIIAGQATAAVELLEETTDLDYIMAPVGGGGLLSGTALSTHYLAPNTQVFAGEPEGANDAWQSLREGKIVPSVNPSTIADGLLTSLGDKTFPIIQKYVAGIFTVPDDLIIAAMKLIWERMKIIIEPSGAVPLAALIKNQSVFKDKRVGIILSGGNVDLERLPF